MKRLKILTIVGTRPELIKMSCLIKALDAHPAFEHTLVHSAQNFDPTLTTRFFDELQLKEPVRWLGIGRETRSPAHAISLVIDRVDALLDEIAPDALLIYGDTNTSLAVIPAKRRRIPVFHMEAGNRCFDQRVPEELNRKIVDHLADINICNTEHARRNLLAEGLPANRIFVAGTPMQEVLTRFFSKIQSSSALDDLGLKHEGYALVSMHREENVDGPAIQALPPLLRAISREYPDKAIVFSLHPRTRKRLGELGFNADDTTGATVRVIWHDPFGFADWLKLQQDAYCTLSDSGTLPEESTLEGFPAVLLREAHERPEAIDLGTVVAAPPSNPERVLQAIEMARTSATHTAPPVDPEDLIAWSKRVMAIVLGYTDFVRRVVWRKSAKQR